jgi:succinate dehydrogenase/fumarate reductase flavoprotein subunit
MKTAGERFDVIVVGFGFAGGIAALEAHDAGARVLLLEKQASPGGISVCSAGGLRITSDAEAAFTYLAATNGRTAPNTVLRVLAQGMRDLPDYARRLTAAVGAELSVRASPANYPFPGFESFGFAYVDEVPGFDPAAEFPAVRGSPAGARLFKVVLENLRRRPGIEIRLASPAERLIQKDGAIRGVIAGGRPIEATRGVILACGGFEAAADLQANWWSMKPVLSAAVRCNNGDGLRMAQSAGAGLWHMWHFHGSYGFRHPDPAYPFGIRVKRLPDWTPGPGLRENVTMSWILVDRGGRRFMNEYDPYLQDTGHRPLEHFDPATQTYPRLPALMVLDQVGRDLYPLSAPTWHDAEVATRFGNSSTPRALDDLVLTRADSIADLARAFDLDPTALGTTIERWNAACAAGRDDEFGRPPGSMLPIRKPPFSAARAWPIVSNTHGGPVHDEQQRVLDAFGAPISGLFAAGELGSVFGHLYMSGGNIAECFIGGRIAGRAAATTVST